MSGTHAAPFVLLDGAWGTELIARGADPSACLDAHNLTHPELVLAIARAYVEAGSQILLTNTFGANRLALSHHGLEAQARAINHAGVALSRQAAQGRARVFGSIGPSRMRWGSVSAAELRAAFAEQATALAEAGAEGLVLETMGDLREALIALEAAQATGLPVVACMSFHKPGDTACDGTTPEQAARAFTEAGAYAVGANCGSGVAHHVAICRRLRSATTLPIWIKPNAGVPRLQEGCWVYPDSAVEFVAHLPLLIAAGAAFVGGCCGTSAETIAALREAALKSEFTSPQ
ncbi:MAG: homocysteine S-methyltransferase family protein [Anaerolineae bacterium]|nr:homocysteine S-methyltransferase family protein [Anaerolineae bacterium]